MKNKKDDYVSVIYDKQRTPKTDYPKRLIDNLVKKYNLNSNSKLLELGCGRGDFLLEFQKYGFDCRGLDRASSSINNELGLKVKKCNLEKESFPYNDASFDVVYHKSVIEHVYDPVNIMQETHRVLKPGGKVIILTPDWHTTWKVFFEDFTHARPYDITALHDLLKVYGFSSLKVEKFYQLPILWKIPFLKIFSIFLQIFLDAYKGRWLTDVTNIKFFRWSVELMVLGYGEKESL